MKIRGFRVELGEIAAVLRGHPKVDAAVVLLREDLPGDKRLVACVVPKPQLEPVAADLRAFLKRTLPEHMIPAVFVSLETLPLGPNGKVDSFEVSLAPGERPRLLSEGEFGWSLKAIPLDRHYIAAIAIEGHDWRPRFLEWQIRPAGHETPVARGRECRDC